MGSLAAELLPIGRAGPALLLIGSVALWGAVFSAGILLGLTWALEIYSGRNRPSGGKIKSALMAGLIAGAISGGVAQAVFTVHRFAGMGQFFFHSGCWGLAGAILGWRLSRAIPNLGATRGAIGGLVGGWLGGMGFLTVAGVVSETIGRLLGVGILGAALGLAMVIVETLCREASLEVIWAPREATIVSLGPEPVSIGGGEDHVYVAGLTQRAATIALEQGRIYYTDTGSGRKTEFRDGSRIKIGTIEMVVHASK